MTKTESVNLTRIFRRDGILRIAELGTGYAVHMRGNVMGTGADIGEAYQNALAERAIKSEVRAAA